jgi:hypothetical protein
MFHFVELQLDVSMIVLSSGCICQCLLLPAIKDVTTAKVKKEKYRKEKSLITTDNRLEF